MVLADVKHRQSKDSSIGKNISRSGIFLHRSDEESLIQEDTEGVIP